LDAQAPESLGKLLWTACSNNEGIANDGELRGGPDGVVRFSYSIWWKETKTLLDQSGPGAIVGGLWARRYLQCRSLHPAGGVQSG
jgi:hypothetical protein